MDLAGCDAETPYRGVNVVRTEREWGKRQKCLSKLSVFRPQKDRTGYKITGRKEAVSWLISSFILGGQEKVLKSANFVALPFLAIVVHDVFGLSATIFSPEKSCHGCLRKPPYRCFD